MDTGELRMPLFVNMEQPPPQPQTVYMYEGYGTAAAWARAAPTTATVVREPPAPPTPPALARRLNRALGRESSIQDSCITGSHA